MLDRVDVHCSWVSQPILDLLPAEIPDVPGGDIIRDPGMGVFCDNAMSLITDLRPEPSPETRALQIKTAMAKLNEVGLVGMHDAGAAPDTLRLFQSLANDDDWTVRVYSMLECAKRNEYCPDDAVKIQRDDHRLAVRSVKLFAGKQKQQHHPIPGTCVQTCILTSPSPKMAPSVAGAAQ